jgi:uncharacterized protein
MELSEQIIVHTKKWINDVIIGCNFCPFAAKVIKQQAVHFEVDTCVYSAFSPTSFLNEINRLDNDEKIETSFLIYSNSFESFDDYVDMVALAEEFLEENEYEGIYQLASFHPLYQFANSPIDDPANFTNRSVYPMLHLLREASIDKALEHYNNPEQIPDRNIDFARNKGYVYMKMLRDACT